MVGFQIKEKPILLNAVSDDIVGRHLIDKDNTEAVIGQLIPFSRFAADRCHRNRASNSAKILSGSTMGL